MISRRLRVHGLVQGVYFRESMRQRAAELHVTGWVRNRADGSVESVVQGDMPAVEVMTDWARRGPPAARVDRVEVESVENEPAHATFEKKPTA